jgi:2-polyprenyl-6-hydroxyphenyl methylase/3-demethylubiquinone-9 3-methyltransferase
MTAKTADAVDWHESIAESFQAGYDHSPRFRERLTLWRDLIARHVAPGDHVLDAGCGAGTFSFEAARVGALVTAIDGSAAMVTLARKRQQELGLANIAFDVALLDSLSARPAGAFDVVLSSSVLEYLPDLAGEVARLVRLLKPGGRLILSMPNSESLYRKAERVAFGLTGRPGYFAHVKSMANASELAALYRALGVEPVEHHFYAAPPGDAVLARLGAHRSKTLLVMVGRRA